MSDTPILSAAAEAAALARLFATVDFDQPIDGVPPDPDPDPDDEDT